VNEVRRVLERIEVPGEHEARGRAWEVVRASFAEREPAPRARRLWRPALAFAVVAALAAAALSPPGRALVDAVRETIGVEGAAPALFELPAGGRVLATSARGVWVVQADGSKRLLGRYREASWSPFGRFVVAARANELAALDPDSGELRWSLARPAVRFPRWGGTRDDTRIAYLSGSRLHVVAGDGTGDVDAGGLPAAARVAPAWRPTSPHAVAYVDTRGRVHVYDLRGSVVLRSGRFARPRALAWSDDGERLLLATADRVVVLDGRRARPLSVRPLRGVVAAAFEPGTHRVALLRAGDVLAVHADRPRARPQVLFAGAGRFAGLAWSPNGRWVLVGWPAADQWVFVRSTGAQRLQAVSSVARQFRSAELPRLEGWCCADG
jgi:hypothetical protein